MQPIVGRIKTFVMSDKGRRVLIVGGVVGIMLLVLPELIPSRRITVAATKTADDFICQTEERLTDLVQNIDGAGACRVMVTLENGVEYVYATQERQNTDRQEDVSGDDTRLTQRDDNESSVIVIDTENGREGLLVTEIQPTIRGVVVVCAGGDDAEVRERITRAVTVALNISEKRVCITKFKE